MAKETLNVPTPAVCVDSNVISKIPEPSVAEEQISKANYYLYSGRDRIGGMESVRRFDKAGGNLLIANHFYIDIDNKLFRALGISRSYKLDAVESICIVNGEIEQYEATVEENRKKSTVRAFKATDNRLVYSGTGPGKEDTFKQIEEGDGFGLHNEQAVASVIKERSSEITKVVLDLDDLTLKEISYSYGGTAQVDVGGASHKTHVVGFQTPTKQGTYWLVPMYDSFIPVLERGVDADGEYSLELQSLEQIN